MASGTVYGNAPCIRVHPPTSRKFDLERQPFPHTKQLERALTADVAHDPPDVVTTVGSLATVVYIDLRSPPHGGRRTLACLP
ncbi:MAG TPA: hypothetical protein VFF30_07135 [Nitrososphaerales archaeon]|nr:hypothetical protein [Nitrososphaerales archaeon]